VTYGELLREVCKFANVLKSLGVRRATASASTCPMIPEAAVAMLACARIGAVHSVVFGGFSAEAVSRPHERRQAKLIITADGAAGGEASCISRSQRRRSPAPRTPASAGGRVRRTGETTPMKGGRDVWYHEAMATASPNCPPEAARLRASAVHPLHLRLDRQTQGIRPHHRGYLLRHTMTMKYVFDLKETDTYWCTADVGWVTGHSYVVYGPLAERRHHVMYEGRPELARSRTASGDHRAARRQHLLHRAHRHPRVHAPGRRLAQRHTT
jgi:acetyl-CoA synthetase